MNLYQISSDIENRLISLGESLERGENPSDEEVATLMGLIEGDLTDTLNECRLSVKNKNANIDAFDKEIEELCKRRDALKKSRDKLKGAIFWALKRTNQDKICFDTGFVRIQKNSSPSVRLEIEADRLPEQFQKITISANTEALKTALKDGIVIDGASLVQGEHLRIG